MSARNLAYRALATAFATTVVVAVAVQQPAAAAVTTLNATVDCGSVNYYGDMSDWYPSNIYYYSNSTGGPVSSYVAIPVNHKIQFSAAIPSGDTAVAVYAKCSAGTQYGDFYGSGGTVSFPAGVSTVNANWICYAAPVSPGPWVTNCSVQSYSYS
ncbi:hypothetical protein J5X84_02870 [Streptosporangiaceae bacterium NEAU-GS5]|nr:hypothetical protein [Streptosporangiaceae bacterium NEAU-GS5]